MAQTASPPTIRVIGEGDAALTVVWDPPAGVTGITGWELRFIRTSEDESDPSNWTIRRSEDISVFSFDGGLEVDLFDGISNGTSYDVQVRASLGAQYSAWSATVAATPREPGRNRRNASTLTEAVRLTGRIQPGSDVDYFSFTLSARLGVEIETFWDVDTFGELRDSRGRLLDDNDDSGRGTNFLIWRTLDPGTYYVKVTSYGNDTGYYVIELDTFVDTTGRADATAISIDSDIRGIMDPDDDRDYYRLDLASATDLLYWSSSRSIFDLKGQVLDSGGMELAADDIGLVPTWDTEQFVIRRSLAAGTHYLTVEPADSETGPYTLHVRGVREPGDSRATAQELELEDVVGGNVGSTTDEDYFRIELSEAAHIVVRGISDEVNIVGAMLESDGSSVTAGHYHQETFLPPSGRRGFTWTGRLDAGSWYVKVTGDKAGPYAITAEDDDEMTELVDSCTAITTSLADPLYGCQWHLSNVGQRNAEDGEDINVEDAWSAGHMGAGVSVAVVDNGLDPYHPDLSANVDATRNHDYRGHGKVLNPLADHGVNVAGVLAARDNAVGGRGVAPRATIYSHNVRRRHTDANEADAMMRNGATTAVSNNSWGPPDDPRLQKATSLWERAVDSGLKGGPGGTGIFYAWAAGNGGDEGDDSNLEEYANYYGVTAACVLDAESEKAEISEEGANLWVCGYGYLGRRGGILTTENYGRYRDDFNGTSTATPQVAGVAALVRGVDSTLTWRDVKLILAASARKNHASDGGWNTGALKYGSTSERYDFNHKYGFGVLDAKAAVDLVSGWTKLPQFVQTAQVSNTTAVSIPDDSSRVTSAVTVGGEVEFVEFVEVNTVFQAPSFRDIRLELVSPAGTVSTLSPPYTDPDGDRYPLTGAFRFGSAAHLGENPAGTWTLRLTDEVSGGRVGSLTSWGLVFHGHRATPGAPAITAVAGSQGSLTVSWDAPSNIGADAVTSYDLRRIRSDASDKGDQHWTVTTGNENAGTLSHTLTGLAVGVQYDVQVRAVNSKGAGLWSATFTGTVNPTVELSVSGVGAVAEGGTLTLTATVSAAPSANLTVPIQRVAGSSTAVAADYSLSPTSITIASGSTTGTTTLTAVTDTLDEQDETLGLELGTVTGHDPGATTQVAITITDNTPTTVTLSVTDATAEEGTSPTTAGIRLTLGRGLVDGEVLAVPLAFSAGTPGTDFTLALSGTPTGVTFSSPTVTFTGPRTGASATVADLTLTPEDDVDAIDLVTTVSTGTLTATGLGGGATGSGSGQITIEDDEIPASCTAASVAVTATNAPDAATAALLAADCAFLLDIKDTLEGDSPAQALNWSSGVSMADWDGIDFPDGRVTSLVLPSVPHGFDGAMPTSFTGLSALKFLRITGHGLTGGVPALPASLVNLDLKGNALAGSIPDLSGLSNLEELTLSSNDLTGRVPALPTGLRFLNLPTNRLSGGIPDLSGLTRLFQVDLTDNELTGGIPALPASVQFLRLIGNDLSGSIPDLRGVTALDHLHLNENGFSGGVPGADRLPTGLKQLWIRDNALDGTSFPDLSTLTELTDIRLDGNALTGSLPAASSLPAGLRVLLLHNNGLTGSIPDLSSLASLIYVYLFGNGLTGSLPAAAELPPNVLRLVLSDNDLDGAIPDLSSIASLDWLYLSGNALTGNVPAAAELPAGIQRLVLGRNELSGGIPDLSTRTSLTHLHLRSNGLTGSVPTTLPTSLQELHLAGNDLANAIPSQLGGLTALTQLSLCGNGLTGTLPSALETKRTANPSTLAVASCASVEDASATEGSAVEFTVTHDTFPVLGSSGAADLTLSYETADGTAESGVDYTGTADGTPGSVTIGGNTNTSTTTGTATISVDTTHDTAIEGDEDFTVTLALPEGATGVFVTGAAATGTIEDDDMAANPKVSLSVSGSTVTEGSTLTVTATVDTAPSGTSLGIPVQRVAGSSQAVAADFTLAGTITIADGATMGTATLTARTDSDDERDETLRIGLGALPDGYDPGTPSHVDITITDNTATPVTLSVPDATASEDTAAATATIRLTLGRALIANEALAVPLQFSGGTVGTDFTLALSGTPSGVALAGGTLTFTGPSATAADVTLTPASDDDAEDRTVTVSIPSSSSGNAPILTATNLDGGASGSRTGNGRITITDDESKGLTFSTSTVNVTEGSSATYTVKLATRPTAAVTVTVSGHNGTDLSVDTDSTTQNDQSTLTFTTSNWNDAQTVTVSASTDNDADNEAPITLAHTASGGGYGSVSGDVTVNITDSDTPTVTLSVSDGGAVTEGGTLTLTATVTRAPSGADLAVPVQVVSADTTAGTGDYSLSGTPAGTITVADGARTGTITLTATQDTDDEPDETLRLELGTVTGYDHGSSSQVDIVITDDDATTVTLSTPDTTATEEDTAATARIQLTLGRGLESGEVLAVPLGFNGGTLDTDFTLALSGTPTGVALAGGTVTFTGPRTGATATVASILLTASPDDDAEDRTVTVSIPASSTGVAPILTATNLDGGATGSRTGAGQITISDDDTKALTFSSSTVNVTEGNSATYTVKLTSEPTSDVTVTVSGHGGTDLSVDTDSTTPNDQSTLTFTDTNWNSAQTVTVSASTDNDSDNEAPITLVHAASGGGYNGVSGSVTVNIIDSDNPTVELSVSGNGAVTEGGTLTVTASVSRAPSGNLAVPVQRVAENSSADASDYTLPAITISSGQTSGTSTFTATNDQADEPDETLRLELGTVSGYDHGTSHRVDIVITDDDPTTVALSVPDTTATEDSSSATATIRLTLGRGLVSGEALAVPLSFTGGTAGTDFTLGLSGSPAGVTFNAATGTVTFTGPQTGATATAANVTLTASSDDDADDRTVTVSIPPSSTGAAPILTATNLDGGATGSRTGAGEITITDDDTKRLVFSAATVGVTEGGSATYTVKLGTKPTNTVTVTVSGHLGTDLTVDTDSVTANDQNTLSFTTSTWNDAQTVTVTAKEDNDTANETAITLAHAASGGGYGSVSGNVTVNITDDDDPKVDLSVNNSGAVTESGTLTITATVSEAPSGRSLAIPVQRVAANSTAVAADYSLGGTPAGTITVADGATAGTITLTATNDSADEPDETLRLELGTLPSGYARGGTPHVDITITDNTPTPVTLSVPDAAATEGSSSATATIRLTLGRALVSGESLAVPLAFSGGARGTDFTLALSGTPAGVTFAGSTVTFTGASATAADVTLTASDDDDAEDRTVTVSTGTLTFTNLDGGATASRSGNGQITITDDETKRLVFSRTTVGVTEGGSANYTVRLGTSPTDTVTVTVSGHAGTDLIVDTDSGRDGAQTTISFTTSTWNDAQTVALTAQQDTDSANEDAITLAHAASGGGYGAVSGNVTVNITDDDPDPDEPTASFALAGASVGEGDGSRNVTVNLQPAAASPITLSYTLSGAAAPGVDYTVSGATGNSGTVTVAAGAASVDITVTIVDDQAVEGNENIVFTLVDGQGYAPGTPRVHRLLITDNDEAPPPPPPPPPDPPPPPPPQNMPPFFDPATPLELTIFEDTTGEFGSPVTAFDPDGDLLDYGLAGADSAPFTIGEFTAQLSVADDANLDASVKDSHLFLVVASDGLVFALRTVSVTVLEVPDPPEPPPPPSQPLKASFNIHDAECTEELCTTFTGNPVTFEDTSTGPVETLAWDTGDGGAYTAEIVTHAWVEPGFYRVTLTVAGGGETDQAHAGFLVRPDQPKGTCEPDRYTLCLQEERYAVEVTWRTRRDETGWGVVLQDRTDDSGMFWFFNADNWEILVKVLDGCHINEHRWVFAASTTDVEYEMTVTDTLGVDPPRTYRNTLGRVAPAISDTAAFPGACRP